MYKLVSQNEKKKINIRMSWSRYCPRWNTRMAPVSGRPPRLTKLVLSAELVSGWLFHRRNIAERPHWTTSLNKIDSAFSSLRYVRWGWGGPGPRRGGSFVNVHKLGRVKPVLFPAGGKVTVFLGKEKFTPCRSVDSYLLTNTRSE